MYLYLFFIYISIDRIIEILGQDADILIIVYVRCIDDKE